MVLKSFYFLGESPDKTHDVEVDPTHDLGRLKEDVGNQFAIIVPSGASS